jgi:hypothetical protein
LIEEYIVLEDWLVELVTNYIVSVMEVMVMVMMMLHACLPACLPASFTVTEPHSGYKLG